MAGDWDDFKAAKEHKRLLRMKFGVDCPNCRIKYPKTTPTKMLPGQKCKVDGYVDPRPPLTQEDHASVESDG